MDVTVASEAVHGGTEGSVGAIGQDDEVAHGAAKVEAQDGGDVDEVPEGDGAVEEGGVERAQHGD